MSKEPLQSPGIDSGVSRSGSLRRRLLTSALTFTGIGAARRFFGEATRDAQAQEISDESLITNLFPARTEGKGYNSRIENDTLVINALEGGSGVAAVYSKEPASNEATISVEAHSPYGVLIGRGTPTDYLRALVLKNGEIRIQKVTKVGNTFPPPDRLDNDDLRVEKLEGFNKLDLSVAAGSVKFKFNDQVFTVPIPEDLIEKYAAGNIVLGVSGNQQETAQATFRNIKMSS